MINPVKSFLTHGPRVGTKSRENVIVILVNGNRFDTELVQV